MAVPDKVYLAFEDGFVAQASTTKEDANGNNIFLSEYIPIEYIRKDALLEKLEKVAAKYKKWSDEGELVWQNMCGIKEAIGILKKM